MKKNYILYSFVILITIIQGSIALNNNSEQIKEKNIVEEAIYEEKYIKDIREDFISFNSITILNYSRLDEGTWKLKCLVKGSKEDIIEDIEELKEYRITNYVLDCENDNILLQLNLINIR